MQEGKREYLRRILDISRGDAGYCDMNTCMKEYNKFMKSLNLCSQRGGEEEKLFIYFHKSGLTVANIVEKKKGKQVLMSNLQSVLKKAQSYYSSVLYPQYKLHALTLSPKDAMIEMTDKLRVNGVISPLDDVCGFISDVDRKWSIFMDYLYKTVSLVFSGDYASNKLRTEEFSDVVQEEIAYYRSMVSEYSSLYDDESGIYYTGKNDNPYKNLYIYCMLSYIRDFYTNNMPRIEKEKFYELEHFEKYAGNAPFTLKDVVETYCRLSGCEYSKAYSKIKQQFRRSEFMKEYKKGNHYEFDKIEIPLATYVYYSKKNHNEPIANPICPYDPLIVYFYAPLLRARMNHDTRINSFINYCDFIVSEFEQALQRVDDAYLTLFLETILESSLRLYTRCVGVDVNAVLNFSGECGQGQNST